MAKVLLGVTGSVAAIKTPELFRQLEVSGHSVKVVATSPALYFFDPLELTQTKERDPEVIVLDEDEWPGREKGNRYQRSDEVLHIELRRWADLLVVAPLDANTLAKFANGMADNCLTCVYRAWDESRPILLAPAMNTMMWEKPVTSRLFRQLGEDLGMNFPPSVREPLQIVEMINKKQSPLRIVPPQVKKLACEDVGIGAMGEVSEITTEVNILLSEN